jgi:hypothetical protein
VRTFQHSTEKQAVVGRKYQKVRKESNDKKIFTRSWERQRNIATGRSMHARTGHSGRQKDIQPTHAGRHSGMEADGYTLHMYADIQACRQMDTLYTCRQTFRHAGRRIHFSHSGRHSGMEADGYTLHMRADIQACRQMAKCTCMQTCRHGGRWLHMQVDILSWRQMATHGGRWL